MLLLLSTLLNVWPQPSVLVSIMMTGTVSSCPYTLKFWSGLATVSSCRQPFAFFVEPCGFCPGLLTGDLKLNVCVCSIADMG